MIAAVPTDCENARKAARKTYQLIKLAGVQDLGAWIDRLAGHCEWAMFRIAELERLTLAMAERIADQSESLSNRAEKRA